MCLSFEKFGSTHIPRRDFKGRSLIIFQPPITVLEIQLTMLKQKRLRKSTKFSRVFLKQL